MQHDLIENIKKACSLDKTSFFYGLLVVISADHDDRVMTIFLLNINHGCDSYIKVNVGKMLD